MKDNHLSGVVRKRPGKRLKIDNAIRLAASKKIDVDKAFKTVTATTQIQSQVSANRYIIPTGLTPLCNSG